MESNKSFLLAAFLSICIFAGWMFFIEIPRMQAEKLYNITHKQKETEKEVVKKAEIKALASLHTSKYNPKFQINLENEKISGEISSLGARINNLMLKNYRISVDKNSKNVILFNESDVNNSKYFADFGWVLAGDSQDKTDLPNGDTIWSSSSNSLTPNNPITLTWKNPDGIVFAVEIAIDKNYLFTIKQSVVIPTYSKAEIKLIPFGRITRYLNDNNTSSFVSHEGMTGVFNKILNEATYEDLAKDGNREISSNVSGWLGFGDKYWLTAMIPNDENFTGNFKRESAATEGEVDRYEASFTGSPRIISATNPLVSSEMNLFAGAKELELLDSYSAKYQIPLFDHAIDFGWYYFLTKPMFKTLRYMNHHFGNFGLAILLLTVFIKVLMIPLANKSFLAIRKMKNLAPEVAILKEKHGDDRLGFNKAVMGLYRDKKVSPLSGCLPIFLQIPIFFSLYKVIFVTIEMRHAPFFGWIHDLSAPDPTSIFNLFGLLPIPPLLLMGIWPILMCITIVIQQKLNPAPTDPVQAKVMKFLPLIMLVTMSSFPSGLIIYWTWSNILSIVQQYIITKLADRAEKIKKGRKARS